MIESLSFFVVDPKQNDTKGIVQFGQKINEIIDAVNDLDGRITRTQNYIYGIERDVLILQNRSNDRAFEDLYQNKMEEILKECLAKKPKFVNTCDSCANAKLGLYKMCYACRSYDHHRSSTIDG